VRVAHQTREYSARKRSKKDLLKLLNRVQTVLHKELGGRSMEGRASEEREWKRVLEWTFLSGWKRGIAPENHGTE